jgi:hypothetical protein
MQYLKNYLGIIFVILYLDKTFNKSKPMRKTILSFFTFCMLTFSISAQDLANSKVAIVRFTGDISTGILNGLDSDEPASDREKELANNIEKRREKFYQDDVFDIMVAKLADQKINILPLEVSDKVARLNQRGYPNPISCKSVIKKKNNGYADYFLNVSINCDKSFMGGGLFGIKPEVRVNITLHDATGQKIKTLNETYKAPNPIKVTDFDEPWTGVIEDFDQLDWFYMEPLLEMLMPLVAEGIEQTIKML